MGAVAGQGAQPQAEPTAGTADVALAQLDALFMGAPVGLAFVDTDLRILRVNERLAAMNGVAVGELVGSRLGDRVADLRDPVVALYRRVMTTGEPLLDQPLTGRLPGSDRDHSWLISLFPVRDHAGAVTGVGAVIQDVTAREAAGRQLDRRVRQQQAIVELGRAALAGHRVDELYETAVSAVAGTLGVRFCSVLEADGDELVVRAAAGWPRPITGVRTPADRTSGAGYAYATFSTLVSDDLAAETRYDVPPTLLEAGIKSSMMTVVAAEDGPVGVLSAHATTPAAFTADDATYLRAIANILAAAVDRADADDALRAERSRLQLALAAGALGVWEWDVETGAVTWSERLDQIFGFAPGEFGRTLADFRARVHPDDVARVDEALQDAVSNKTTYDIQYRIVRVDDGAVRWVHASGRLEHAASSTMTGVASDVTERVEAEQVRLGLLEAERQARADAEAAQERLQFLARASEVLSSSLNYRRTLTKLANLIVPRLADWCTIHIVEDDRRAQQIVAHVDPDKVAMAEELQRRWPPNPDAPSGAWNVIRTGVSELYSEIPEELLVAAAVGEEHLRVLRELGLRSSVVVPLVARNRTLGAVSLISSESGHIYTPTDLAFIEDVARRAATAIDNARLYQERSHVARALQHALLPPDLPILPGLDLAATYRPMSELSEIGGDFYDVFESADGSWTIAVGDVEGKGPEAAAVTGLARHTIRAAAVRERSPARILGLLNEVLVHDREVPRFCTVALGTVRPSTEATDVTISSGGHPPPLVLRHDGTVEAITTAGSLLGAFDDPTFTEATVTLRHGDALVIYTDGVTETRRDREPFGDERLVEALAACAGRSAKAVADSIEGAVVEWQPEHREDDLAILVVRVEPEA